MRPRPSIQDIRRLSEDVDHAQWIDPPKMAFEVSGKRLNVSNMLFVNDVYLVEAVEDLNAWWIGEKRADGAIECWAKYESLYDAILAL